MKSQDIFILLKLVSLQKQEEALVKETSQDIAIRAHGWEGWSLDESALEEVEGSASKFIAESMDERYTMRGLAAELGVSKTEVSSSIKRSMEVGMAVRDRMTGRPKVNNKALVEFVNHGLKYVFPAKKTGIVRGIPTSFAAPVMEGKIMTAGDIIYVWPDAHGKNKGQAIEPLFKTVPRAVRKDRNLYELLALVDAVRMGSPRESKLAQGLFEERVTA